MAAEVSQSATNAEREAALSMLDDVWCRDQARNPEYQTTLRLNPDHPYAHAGLGIDLLWLKQFPEAEVELRVAIRRAPNWD